MGGERQRQRTCSNPEPAFGGRNCSGSTIEKDTCNIKNCTGIVAALKKIPRAQLFYTLQIPTTIMNEYEKKPHAVSAFLDGTTFYTGDFEGMLYQINLDTNAVKKTLAVHRENYARGEVKLDADEDLMVTGYRAYGGA